MSSEIHFVLQGKGGVGKSVAARLLVEYMIHTGRNYVAFDADAVNQSLAAVEAFNVKKVELLDGGEVQPRKFDALMGEILDDAGSAVIVDCGASSFLPLMGYIETAGAVDMLIEESFEVFIHTVVTGGPAFGDTIAGFEQLARRFGESCNVVVWRNPIFGPVEKDGVDFLDLPDVKKLLKEDRISGEIPIPVLHRMTQEDFSEFLTSNTSFSQATAKDNASVNTMVRRRLIKVQAELMSAIRQVIGVEEAENTDA